MNIAHWLERAAQRTPDALALMRGAQPDADYAEFGRRAAALARWLVEDLGVAPGDRVGLFLKNRAEYLEALYAIWWAGAVAAPINAKLVASEAAFIVEDAEAKVVFVDDTVDLAHAAFDGRTIDVLCDAFRRARDGVAMAAPLTRAPDDLAWLFYTSGTTGRPKGVMLSHANLMAMTYSYLADVDAVTGECATIYAAPMSHGAGLYNFVFVLKGARHVVPGSGGFEALEVLELAERVGEASLFAAPTMVKRMVQAARSGNRTGEGLRLVVYGGGPMYLADIKAALQVLGPRFAQIYGQGETPMTITALPRDAHRLDAGPEGDRRLASVGRAHSVVQVRVAGADGTDLPVGDAGEVQAKGLTVMSGYWRRPEATAETLADGWLRTGDVGRFDDEGYLTLTDRTKDVIISGGSNIYPREVEEVLLTCPGVREAAVVGAPDPEWGEVVCAVLVADAGGPDDATLDRHCVAHMARFKRPKRYLRVAELPKNNYGKVLKTSLRDLVRGDAAQA